jgi:hypothetical protein
MCTGLALFFTKKDDVYPVGIELRPMDGAVPSTTEYFSGTTVFVKPQNVNLYTSTAGAKATQFTFEHPIYLKPGTYAFSVLTKSAKYELFCSGKASATTTTFVTNPRGVVSDIKITSKLIQNLQYKTYGYSDNDLPNDLTSLQQYFTDPNNSTIQNKMGFNDVNFMWWRKLTDYPEWTENPTVQTYFSGVEELNFLPAVDNISLAPIGVPGDCIFDKQTGDMYHWNPAINNWSPDSPVDILTTLRDKRDYLIVRYNEMLLAMLPYLYTSNYFPKYQITKYKNF